MQSEICRIGVMAVYAKTICLTNREVIKQTHRQQGGPMIKKSLLGKYYKEYFGRKDISVAQFR